MKKQIAIKIISGAIIFIFAMFFLQAISPLKVNAATTGLNWTNPNASGNNPYKFKPQDVLNSQLIMQVVGCTGVVDKISVALSKLFQKATQAAIVALQKKVIEKACTNAKAGAQFVSGALVNLTITTALGTKIDCNPILNASDAGVKDQLLNQAIKDDATKRTTECFNGIAATLAKNQLTAMTRYTMNWVNSGFNGNPMYVQNITSLTNSLEKGVLESGIAVLTSPNNAYPYGADFSRTMINSYQSGAGLRSGATNFLDSLTSDLSNFVSDPKSYVSDTALQRAQKANDAFANDFSTGGWNAWLALTQKDQNNPLGFAMQVSQYEADQQAAQIQSTNNELLQNNGFLSQKKCVEYEKPSATNSINPNGAYASLCSTITPQNQSYCQSNAPKVSAGSAPTTPKCIRYDTVTPGSIIKDQLSNFVNSPVRQLELAKTINDSLNSVFSALIATFQNQGLPGLSSDKYTYTNPNMGVGPGSNSSTDLLGNSTSLSSGYTDGSFDLTRDLGNIYIHNYAQKAQGNWNAATNLPELNIGVAPLDDQGNPLVNVYYVVSVGGNTKLITNGYNGWAVGDRAFWNGSEWQNWKKGNTDPINKRGVIQIQQDYIVAAKELLSNLPAIMPKIGELDYCIPGPNPNWQANSYDAYTTFSDYAYSLTSEYKAGSLLKRDSSTYQIAQPGEDPYDNYYKIFDGTTIFNLVTQTETWINLNILGNAGTVKNNLSQDKLQSMVGDLLTKIGKYLQDFNTQYNTAIESVYGATGLMQKQFLEKENTSVLIPNTAWLPVASDALSITKDITNYASDIAQNTQDYKDNIIQANANISKLNVIKDQVSVIIKAAQKRRDDNLIKILADEALRNGTPVLTGAQYKAKYAACLTEENIVFYEDTAIMGNTGSEAGRCTDGIDNDLNGLTDAADPACK